MDPGRLGQGPQLGPLVVAQDLQVGGVELTLPNWLFQALGLTAHDVRVEDDRLVLSGTGRSLTVRHHADGVTRLGDCLYRHEAKPLNLGPFLTSPRLWLGNAELVEFVDLRPDERVRPGYSYVGRLKGLAELRGVIHALTATRR